MSILDRYILSETLRPFLVALAAFVTLLTGHMLFAVVEVIVEHGVPLPSVLRFVALQVPGAAVMALPMSVLMGACLAVNRLASDHEITAMRAGGASLVRAMVPLWGLGLVATLATFAINEGLVPRCRTEAERLVREMVLRRQSLAFEPERFTDTGEGIQLYIGDRITARQELEDVMIFQRQAGEFPLLITAPRAVFQGEHLYPVDARTYYYDRQQGPTVMASGSVDIDLRGLARAASSAPGAYGVSEMPLWELVGERQTAEEQAPGAGRSYEVEIHSRLAMVASCLVFALLAGPVTLRFARGQSLVGVMAALIIAFGYFLVMLWTRTLGEAGALPVPLAAWIQNGVLAAVAIIGLWRMR
ncbi:MAG TPA: LptF/LptG family permease [Armatimonadota bacterium]|nr:LptF/LptG family permease [Armatimonadota bacterium]